MLDLSLCEVLDLGYAVLAENYESLEKLDDALGLNERDQSSTLALIMEMGGEIG